MTGTSPKQWILRDGRWLTSASELRHVPESSNGKPIEQARGEIAWRLPGLGCREIEFAATALADHPSTLCLVVDDLWFDFAASGNRETCLYDRGVMIAYNRAHVATPGKAHRLAVRGDGRAIRFSVDRALVFEHRRDRAPPYRQVGLLTWCDATFKDIEITPKEIVAASPPPARCSEFLVSAGIDFSDDLIAAPFTKDMVSEMMDRLSEIGVRRIYWNCTGRFVPELWTDPEVRAHFERSRAGDNLFQTVLQGWKWFETAAKAAHEAGMEAYAFFKPFDFGLPPSRDPKSCFLMDQRFIQQHAEMLLARRPEESDVAPPSQPIAAIRFVKDDAVASPVRPEDLHLWISDDNRNYRLYDGPLERTESIERRQFRDWWTNQLEQPRDVCVLSLEGLRLSAPCFAVTCESSDRRDSFRNKLYRLTEIVSANGKAVPFTYGVVVARRARPIHAPPSNDTRSFQTAGFRIGAAPTGVPTGALSGPDGIEYFWALDNAEGVIGFQRGCGSLLKGTLCPAYPEVREFWLDLVRATLDQGADGMDIRIGHHNNILDWAEYGFNAPVVEEFRSRYGHDITRGPADRERHQRLMGEFYDEFVREAAALVRGGGKKLQLHVHHSWDIPPSQRQMTCTYWNWRRWIEEGWADAITLKEVFPGTNFFDEVVDFTTRHGVATHFCPYLNSHLVRSPVYEEVIRSYLEQARTAGLNGMILYEVACFLRGSEDGKVSLVRPGVAEAIRDLNL